VLFANEEFGLSGANAYAAQLASKPVQHVLGLEADMGADRVWRFDTRVPENVLPTMKLIAKALEPLGIESGNNTAYGGADLGPLQRQGLPVLGLVQDMRTYFDYHHSADDTLDKIDPDALDQAVAAYSVAAWLASVMDGDFGKVASPAAANH
jgi:carboxypeptidase Q